MRSATFLALAVGVALLAGSIGLGVRERSQKRLDLDHALQTKSTEEARALENYFERARSILLLTANNPAFDRFYRLPGGRAERVKAHGPVVRQAEDSLAYLERLYPGSIGEACFIDRGGAENARIVWGERAPFADLSPDESANPFFHPTFALAPGHVYQAQPYVSPDTKEWVISNSTPLSGARGLSPAIVHFEVTVESFRREAAAIASRFEIAIIESSTGRVVLDSQYPQRVGARLGRPEDRRFADLPSRGASGLATIGSRRSAFQRLKSTMGNANDWYVAVTARAKESGPLGGVGTAPLGMGGAALALLVLSAVSFRSSRRALQRMADTDSLTGLRNRRALMADLGRACERAVRGEGFALVLFDLDGFKTYNDTFGHVPGDALLARLGRKLAGAVDDATAYRLGGDEFCLLAPLGRGAGGERMAALGAGALAERGEGFSITATYGSVVLPDDASEPSTVLATADLRMYARKQNSRASAARQTSAALARVLEERSPLMGPHTAQVAGLAEEVARRLSLPENRLQLLRHAAQLHDVGKVAIPDAVLEKAGPLTREEWALMREHTVIGQRILMAAPALVDAARVVRSTHERYDGTGYPDALRGDSISLEARIIAAADAFCAMRSKRPYRAPLSHEAAVQELRRCAGTQFDPTIVEALLVVLADRVTQELPAAT